MTDNPEPIADNSATQTAPEATPITPEAITTPETPKAPEQPNFSWKAQLGVDLGNAPTMQKFEDNTEGLKKAMESHLNLEKLLGNDKVPLPKGPADTEGWARLQKALGVPDNPDGYKLPDTNMPDVMKGMAFDKDAFEAVAHKLKLTPDQAKQGWEEYTNLIKTGYQEAMKAQDEQVKDVVNEMRAEWGGAYEANVELGQMVINKFSTGENMQDWLTSNLSKDPMGIKFLAHIGNQFAENKIGDFGFKRFALTPDQALEEIQSIQLDMSHPYNNDKASPAEREKAIDYVNSLYTQYNKGKG